MVEYDGEEKYAIKIKTHKKGFHELTLLAQNFEEQEAWVNAIDRHMQSLQGGEQSSLGGGESSPLHDKSGWLDLMGACKHKTTPMFCLVPLREA